jgi:hypothetical protein
MGCPPPRRTPAGVIAARRRPCESYHDDRQPDREAPVAAQDVAELRAEKHDAAITSVYSVIAVCTPWVDVANSAEPIRPARRPPTHFRAGRCLPQLTSVHANEECREFDDLEL